MYDEYEDYELYARKRSDKVKWVISFILIIVLLACVVGAWVMLLKPKESEPESEESGAIITEGESHGMKLMSTRIAPEDYGNAYYERKERLINKIFECCISKGFVRYEEIMKRSIA